MNLNLVVSIVANLKFEWFDCTTSEKSSGFIESLSKIKWFHGTTGNTTNVGPVSLLLYCRGAEITSRYPLRLLTYLMLKSMAVFKGYEFLMESIPTFIVI